MVQETIKTVKETEMKAGQLVKEAEMQCTAIIDKAKEEAKTFKEQKVKTENELARTAMDSAKKEAEQFMGTSGAEIDKEAEALKESASSKEAQAVELVISQLY